MECKCRWVLSAVVILTAASVVQPFPSGAPSQACSDLRPQHGGAAQTTRPPFELDVSVFRDIAVTYSYKPSTTYNRKL